MDNRSNTNFKPDYAVIPGKTLEESLSKSGMTQGQLAERTGLSRKTINGIINGREPITPETAIQLEKVFRVPARFWSNLQVNYDEACARIGEQRRMEAHVNWIEKSEIPFKELIKRRLIPAVKNDVELLTAGLSFFGVTSPDGYQSIWGATQQAYSFRKATTQRTSFGAISAWLRIGELQAVDIDCAPFDKSLFKRSIESIRAMATEDIEKCYKNIVTILAECGIALVFVPGITGAPIYGATRWLTPSKAIVQMSLRGKDDGNFWFTLFHELAHILLHKKEDIFLEIDKGASNDKEKEADEFARNILIPNDAFQSFLQAHGSQFNSGILKFRKSDIVAFAQKMNLPPGVVVGRLHREKRLPYTHCHDLKVKLGFAE